jgi:hypothetical protein
MQSSSHWAAYQVVVCGIFSVCAITSCLALWLFSMTSFGFALTVGSALVAYQSFIVGLRIYRRGSGIVDHPSLDTKRHAVRM